MEPNTPDLPSLVQLLNSGGNAALMVCTFFIYRASERLARIEKALDRFINPQESK